MQKLGKKQLIIELTAPISGLPESLLPYVLMLSEDGRHITYTYDTKGDSTGITVLLQDLNTAGLGLKDLQTTQSSLEDIFVELIRR